MKATDTPHSLRVFLCHSSGDKPAVRELYQRLCAEGIDAWLDEEKLLPGQDWQREIPKAVRASDVVIVCLSRGSITKAADIARLSLWEFADLVKQRNVEWVRLAPEDVEREFGEASAAKCE